MALKSFTGELDKPATGTLTPFTGELDLVEPRASLLDVAAGTPLARLAMGVASPVIGVAQLGAHVGDLANEAMGVKPIVSPWLDKALADFEAAKRRGMKASGTEGVDAMGLIGSLAPSAALAKGVSAGLPVATTLLQRFGLGAVQGGVAGATQPVLDTSQGFWSPKGMQTTVGAVTGGLVPLVTEGGKKLANFVSQAAQPFTETGRAAILKNLQEAVLGNDPHLRKIAIDTLRSAKPGVGGVTPTAGEVLAGIDDPAVAAKFTGIMAHQKNVAKLPGVSPEFAKRAAEQEAARAGELIPIARNEGALAGEQAIRDTVTAPMRERALSAVNERGEVARTIADKLSNLQKLTENEQRTVGALSQPSVKRTLVSEGPSDALRSSVEIHAPYAPPEIPGSIEKVAGAHFESKMNETLAQQAKGLGVAQSNVGALTKMQEILRSIPVPPPLKASSLVQQLNLRLKTPEIEGSPYTQKALLAIKGHIAEMADSHGIIDARSLYQFKKEGVNQLIDATMEKTNPRFAEKFRSGELIGIKKAIDNAIEDAGGKGWKDYLLKYHELSAHINRMESGQSLQKALVTPLETGERGQSFAKALRDTDVSALSGTEQISMRKIAEELARKDAFERLARQTSLSGKDAIPGQVGLPLPNLLYRPSMIANFMLRHAGQGAEEKIAKLAASQYLQPNQLAAALEDVPVRYAPLMNAMRQRLPGMAGAAIGRAAQP